MRKCYLESVSRRVNWVGRMFRRNCLLKHIIEGKFEEGVKAIERRGRRRKQHVYGVRKGRDTGN